MSAGFTSDGPDGCRPNIAGLPSTRYVREKYFEGRNSMFRPARPSSAAGTGLSTNTAIDTPGPSGFTTTRESKSYAS